MSLNNPSGTVFLNRLSDTIDDPQTTKETLVELIGGYLPNFAHIETGKSLDSKM